MSFSSAENLHPDITRPSHWNLSEVAGRLIEISASTSSASLTLTLSLVRETQEKGEPAGWVTAAESAFYPPDAARGGIDLAALVVIRVRARQNIARAGEKLLRSGAFGLIVLDLGGADIPMPLQSRLTGLAQHHHTGLVCVTEKAPQAFSLGSLVSLRAHAEKNRSFENRFACALRVLKDKRRGPTWKHEKLYLGPAGLC
jgi:recombination protein RecA